MGGQRWDYLFVIKVDADTFKLAASEDDANEGTEITLTDTGNDADYYESRCLWW